MKSLRNCEDFLVSREDRIRTCDPMVPNHVFYRAELPPENYFTSTIRLHFFLNLCESGEGGIRTLGTTLRSYDGLANR
jgi:hypothetical protein